MKKSLSRLSAIILSGAMLCSSIALPAFAEGTQQSSDEAKRPSLFLEKEEAELSKDETVYVFTEADGKVNNIIVSDRLKNFAGADKIADKSELSNIENVKGDESFSKDGGNLSWNAGGKDIYYRGSTEKALPVDMKISYTLDGKNVSASEIVGKSGKLTIRFDYKNTTNIPFAAATVMILDGEIFEHVTVENGREMSDGSRTAVIGVSFPNLKDILGVDPEKLRLSEYVEISADVKNFEMTNTFTIITSEPFSNLNTEAFDTSDGLSDSISQLESGMNELVIGSSELAGGLDELLDKSGELVSGVEKLYTGSSSLKDGAKQLCGGAGELSKGAGELEKGLEALDKNSDVLAAGSKQVFESLLEAADAQLASSGEELPKLTVENYSQVLEGVIAKLNAAKADSTAVTALKAQLDSYNQFYNGLISYTQGAAAAKEASAKLRAGAASLESGANELAKGADSLEEGLKSLNDSAPALTDGVAKLSDGSHKLNEGIVRFNDEGISKLISAFSTDELNKLSQNLKAAVEASKEFNSFCGIADDSDGSVRFIYRTEAIG